MTKNKCRPGERRTVSGDSPEKEPERDEDFEIPTQEQDETDSTELDPYYASILHSGSAPGELDEMAMDPDNSMEPGFAMQIDLSMDPGFSMDPDSSMDSGFSMDPDYALSKKGTGLDEKFEIPALGEGPNPRSSNPAPKTSYCDLTASFRGATTRQPGLDRSNSTGTVKQVPIAAVSERAIKKLAAAVKSRTRGQQGLGRSNSIQAVRRVPTKRTSYRDLTASDRGVKRRQSKSSNETVRRVPKRTSFRNTTASNRGARRTSFRDLTESNRGAGMRKQGVSRSDSNGTVKGDPIQPEYSPAPKRMSFNLNDIPAELKTPLSPRLNINQWKEGVSQDHVPRKRGSILQRRSRASMKVNTEFASPSVDEDPSWLESECRLDGTLREQKPARVPLTKAEVQGLVENPGLDPGTLEANFDGLFTPSCSEVSTADFSDDDFPTVDPTIDDTPDDNEPYPFAAELLQQQQQQQTPSTPPPPATSLYGFHPLDGKPFGDVSNLPPLPPTPARDLPRKRKVRPQKSQKSPFLKRMPRSPLPADYTDSQSMPGSLPSMPSVPSRVSTESNRLSWHGRPTTSLNSPPMPTLISLPAPTIIDQPSSPAEDVGLTGYQEDLDDLDKALAAVPAVYMDKYRLPKQADLQNYETEVPEAQGLIKARIEAVKALDPWIRQSIEEMMEMPDFFEEYLEDMIERGFLMGARRDAEQHILALRTSVVEHEKFKQAVIRLRKRAEKRDREVKRLLQDLEEANEKTYRAEKLARLAKNALADRNRLRQALEAKCLEENEVVAEAPPPPPTEEEQVASPVGDAGGMDDGVESYTNGKGLADNGDGRHADADEAVESDGEDFHDEGGDDVDHDSWWGIYKNGNRVRRRPKTTSKQQAGGDNQDPGESINNRLKRMSSQGLLPGQQKYRRSLGRTPEETVEVQKELRDNKPEMADDESVKPEEIESSDKYSDKSSFTPPLFSDNENDSILDSDSKLKARADSAGSDTDAWETVNSDNEPVDSIHREMTETEASLRMDITKKNEFMTYLEKINRDLFEENEMYIDEISARNYTIKELEAEAEISATKISTLTADLSTRDYMIKELEAEAKAAPETSTALVDCNNRVENLKDDLQKLKSERDFAIDTMEALQKQIAAFTADLSARNDIIKVLEENIKSAAAKAVAETAALADCNSTVKGLKDENQNLQQANVEKDAALKAADDLQKKLNDCEEERKKLRDDQDADNALRDDVLAKIRAAVQDHITPPETLEVCVQRLADDMVAIDREVDTERQPQEKTVETTARLTQHASGLYALRHPDDDTETRFQTAQRLDDTSKFVQALLTNRNNGSETREETMTRTFAELGRLDNALVRDNNPVDQTLRLAGDMVSSVLRVAVPGETPDQTANRVVAESAALQPILEMHASGGAELPEAAVAMALDKFRAIADLKDGNETIWQIADRLKRAQKNLKTILTLRRPGEADEVVVERILTTLADAAERSNPGETPAEAIDRLNYRIEQLRLELFPMHKQGETLEDTVKRVVERWVAAIDGVTDGTTPVDVIRNLKAELGAAQDDLSNAQANLDEANSTVAGLNEQITDLDQTIADLDQRVRQAPSEADLLVLTRERFKAEAERDQARDQLAQAHVDRDDQQARANGLQGQLEALDQAALLAERDAAVHARNIANAERDRVVAERDPVVVRPERQAWRVHDYHHDACFCTLLRSFGLGARDAPPEGPDGDSCCHNPEHWHSPDCPHRDRDPRPRRRGHDFHGHGDGLPWMPRLACHFLTAIAWAVLIILQQPEKGLSVLYVTWLALPTVFRVFLGFCVWPWRFLYWIFHLPFPVIGWVGHALDAVGWGFSWPFRMIWRGWVWLWTRTRPYVVGNHWVGALLGAATGGLLGWKWGSYSDPTWADPPWSWAWVGLATGSAVGVTLGWEFADVESFLIGFAAEIWGCISPPFLGPTRTPAPAPAPALVNNDDDGDESKPPARAPGLFDTFPRVWFPRMLPLLPSVPELAGFALCVAAVYTICLYMALRTERAVWLRSHDWRAVYGIQAKDYSPYRRWPVMLDIDFGVLAQWYRAKEWRQWVAPHVWFFDWAWERELEKAQARAAGRTNWYW